jgi:hypothetical protein
MRKTLLGLTAIAGLAAAFIAGSAAAEPYKWCAEFSGAMGGANCGFVTEQQCLATIAGTGGFCRPNGFYTGDSDKLARPARKRNPG